MNKKEGLSVIGYAIVVVILIAVGMIVSAPFVIEQNQYPKNSERTERINVKSEESTPEELPPRDMHVGNVSNTGDFASRRDLDDLENRVYNRLDVIERNYARNNSSKDNYVCSIGGGLNDSGIVVPIDPDNPPAKFVFVCEYRR